MILGKVLRQFKQNRKMVDRISLSLSILIYLMTGDKVKEVWEGAVIVIQVVSDTVNDVCMFSHSVVSDSLQTHGL